MLLALFHRRQFSLATLFAVVTLVAVVAAGYGMYRRAVLAEEFARQVEDRALAKIAAKGAVVILYDEGAYVEFLSPGPAPKKLLCGTGLRKTYVPTGSSSGFSDPDLALFGHVRRPLAVDFRNTSVSPKSVAQFRSRYPNCRVEY